MKPSNAWAWPVAVVLLLGCGDDVGPTDGSGGAGGGSGVGAGGSGGAPTIEAPTCGPGETVLSGDVAGTSVDATVAASLYYGDAETWLTWFSNAPSVRYADAGELTLDGPPGQGVPAPVHGVLRLGGDGAMAGQFICAGEGSAVQVDDAGNATATLRTLSLVGACPGGEPVAGTLELCLGCDVSTAVSTLETAPFEDVQSFSLGLSEVEATTALVQGAIAGHGVFVFESAPLGPLAESPATAPVATGYFIAPMTSADPGAVYCVGGGSFTYTRSLSGGALPKSAVLENLTRLGTCGAPVDGQIGICASTAPAP